MKNNMNEVYPGIFRIEEKSLFNVLRPPVNIYIITGSNGLVFDAGYGSYYALNYFDKCFEKINNICRIRKIPNNIRRILVSHAHSDHFAGMKGISTRHDLDVVLTEKIAAIIKDEETYRQSFKYNWYTDKISTGFYKKISRFSGNISYRLYSKTWGIEFIDKPDIIIDDNCTITINNENWQVIHSPGHSDDHISLYNPLTGFLFAGDNILRSKFTWLGPPRSDIDMYIASLEYLLTLENLKLVLPAHGSIINNPRERIRQIISYWNNRMEQLRCCLAGTGIDGISFYDIVSFIYPDSGRVKHVFVRGWIQLLIEKMIKDGFVYFKNGRFYRTGI